MSDIGRTVYNFHNQGRVLPLIRMRRHLTTEQAAFALIECTIATAISTFFLAFFDELLRHRRQFIFPVMSTSPETAFSTVTTSRAISCCTEFNRQLRRQNVSISVATARLPRLSMHRDTT